MRQILLPILIAATMFGAPPAPRFRDADRVQKLKAALPEIEKVFERYHRERGLPGSAWGVVIDGELVYTKQFGVRERQGNDPVTADTAFRIASMTKSFTAAALLKLRDEGRLSLEDPVEKWIPEFKGYKYPTADTSPIRVKQLVNHGAGFPEDNPWGDRQLAEPDAVLARWVKEGIPFSTTPDTEYEYSNYGFALAGRVIQKASGMSYRDYVEKKILAPLGMTGSSLEPKALDGQARAVGYGRRGDGYFEIESLAHGSFGAMGGLVTTSKDLAKWVAYQLSAFPPRDEADSGPVKRASLREMQRLQRTSNFFADRGGPNNGLRATAGGYGYGLGVSQDCRFGHIVGHGGGLPGFGSYMMWLPEYGVGMFAMTNLTYQGPSPALSEAFDVLRGTGALKPRELPPAPVLTATRDALWGLWQKWDDGKFEKLAANNLFMDFPAAERRKEIAAVQDRVGKCEAPGEVEPENWLRGEFRMNCEKGQVVASFTLAPTQPPTVQMLRFQAVGLMDAKMKSGAEQWLRGPGAVLGAGCRLGPVLMGDGRSMARVVLECERGPVAITFRMDGEGNLVAGSPQRAPGARCAP